jgi:outer membrane protein assembly factor BamB
MTRFRSTIVAAALTFVVAPAARADDWPTPGLDLGHSRLSAERSGAGFSDGRWSYRPASQARALASPVVADGFVISAGLDGGVSAVRADSGQLVWQAVVGSPVQGTPAICHGRVFIPTLRNKIVALGLADGAALWTTDIGGMNFSSPATIDNDLIVAAGFPQRHLVRLDGATGAIVWTSPASMEQFSNTAPAVSGGLVVVGTNGGHYYAFDAASGGALWDYRADGIVHLAAPLIVGGRVYMAGGDDSDHVHAVDALTGAAISGWPITLPSPDPDVPGARIDRHRAVSSFASAGGLLILQTRLDDALDTNGDGIADQFLSRETVVAIDPSAGTVTWQHPLGRKVFADPNDVPKFFVCPTPAAFGTAGGTPFVAAASSLAATVTILGALGGNDAGDLTVSGRALASPVMANGRLITVAESGVVEGQLSNVNHPPAAPILAANPRPLDSADVTLRWMAAADPDAEQPSYEVRIDADGEVLRNCLQQLSPADGATSVRVLAPLSPGVTYTVAVRARDPEGALSGWSAPETFTVTPSGTVSVDGTPAANLSAAVTGAAPGSIVTLGAGTFPLSQTLHVGAGVSIAGAGAGRTILDASGLSVGLTFDGADPIHNAGLDRATVTGADTCVSVVAGHIALTHLVVHDCATAGIAVAVGGAANVANATLVGNGIGVNSAGLTTIKNSILTGNGVGLFGATDGALVSSYNDLFGNPTDCQGLALGTHDLATAVTFADSGGHDFRLTSTQPSTDKGDPTDDIGSEPAPNGARINLGAFGGTADAEPSAVLTPVGDPSPASPTPIPPNSPAPPKAGDGGGCRVARGSPNCAAVWLLALSWLITAWRRRRPRTRASAATTARCRRRATPRVVGAGSRRDHRPPLRPGNSPWRGPPMGA